MAKITNIRERVHQPLRDALIRTSGNYVSNVQDRTDLFTVAGGDQGKTNLQNGSTLPSDQSMVVLALRTFLWFRNPQLRAEDAAGNVTVNGDILPADFVANQNTGIGSAEDVHRLYFQASEQLLWSVGAGQKYSLTSMPSAYFPYGGGLHGRIGHATQNCGPGPVACGNVSVDNVVSVPGVPAGAGTFLEAAVEVPRGQSCCQGVFLYEVKGTSGDPPAWAFTVSIWNGTDYEEVGTVDGDETPLTLAIVDPASGDPCFTISISPPDTAKHYGFVVVTQTGVPEPQPLACAQVGLIHWNNGTPEAGSLARLARAILIPPRQNILVSAQIVSYADNPQSAVATQGSRNLLSLTSNLNQQDYINKVITMTLDGLLSRDVQ